MQLPNVKFGANFRVLTLLHRKTGKYIQQEIEYITVVKLETCIQKLTADMKITNIFQSLNSSAPKKKKKKKKKTTKKKGKKEENTWMESSLTTSIYNDKYFPKVRVCPVGEAFNMLAVFPTEGQGRSPQKRVSKIWQ